MIKETKAHVIIRFLKFFFVSTSFSAGAAVVEGTGPPAGAAPATRTDPRAPTLQMRLPMLTLSRDFSDKLSQKGSTFTPGDLMRAFILSPLTCMHHLIIMQDEGQVDAGEL